MRSPYSQKNQSDVQSTLCISRRLGPRCGLLLPPPLPLISALDNLRYAVSFCLFGVPFNRQLINTPCITR